MLLGTQGCQYIDHWLPKWTDAAHTELDMDTLKPRRSRAEVGGDGDLPLRYRPRQPG